MASDAKLAKATLLGGFAAGALLCFCLSLTSAACFSVALLYLDDDRAGGYGPPVVTTLLVLSLTASGLVSSVFGWRVGRDWYRNGR